MFLRSWAALTLLLILSGSVLAEDAPILKPGEKAGDLWEGNTLGIKFCWCPPGKFTMGSPASEPGHTDHENQVDVTLTRGFWLGQYEITQAEWEKVMRTKPWKAKGAFRVKEEGSRPAVYVKRTDASAFCEKLTANGHSEGWLPQDWKVDLPTEAQWEYACRAGTTTRFSFGDDESQLGQYAWFNPERIDDEYARPVGQKKPNPWNLYDMHGNVYEWCRDYYAEKLPGGIDPNVREMSRYGVHRGGGWHAPEWACRSARRNKLFENYGINYVGFRVALVQPGTR